MQEVKHFLQQWGGALNHVNQRRHIAALSAVVALKVSFLIEKGHWTQSPVKLNCLGCFDLIEILKRKQNDWIIQTDEIYSSSSNNKTKGEDIQYMIAEKKEKRPQKAHVNKQFFRQLKALLGKLCDNCGSFWSRSDHGQSTPTPIHWYLDRCADKWPKLTARVVVT